VDHVEGKAEASIQYLSEQLNEIRNDLERLQNGEEKESRCLDYRLDFLAIDFRKHPEKYRIDKVEQGVLVVEPYKARFSCTGDLKPELKLRSRRLGFT
jgi:hypothetical protein